MKTLEVAEATAPLADYARTNRRQTLVLTRKGRPYAALTPISTPTDLENLQVSNSPVFRALIARGLPRHGDCRRRRGSARSHSVAGS
jgi:antitoxin (DNA-binding transcriptional repressor) of toxin-antitoxin stability system